MSGPQLQMSDDLLARTLRQRAGEPDSHLAADILNRIATTPQIRPWWPPLSGAVPRPVLVFALIALLLAALAGIGVGAALLGLFERDQPRNGAMIVGSDAGCALQRLDAASGSVSSETETLVGCRQWSTGMRFDVAASRYGEVLVWSTYRNCGRCTTQSSESFQAATGIWVRDASGVERHLAECRDAGCLVDVSADGDLIAYVIDPWGGGDGSLVIAEVSGAEVARLTVPAWTLGRPHFSTDGSMIALAATDELGLGTVMTVASNGAGLRSVLSDPDGITDIAWAPDDRRIAIVAWDRIVAFRSDGSDATTLDEAVGPAYYQGLAWSVDGRNLFTVLTTRDLGPDSIYEQIVPFEGLISVDLDTDTPRSILHEANGDCCIWGFTLSPDGQQILFSNREPPDENSWLTVMNVDGSEMRRVTVIGNVALGERQPLLWLPER